MIKYYSVLITICSCDVMNDSNMHCLLHFPVDVDKSSSEISGKFV